MQRNVQFQNNFDQMKFWVLSSGMRPCSGTESEPALMLNTSSWFQQVCTDEDAGEPEDADLCKHSLGFVSDETYYTSRDSLNEEQSRNNFNNSRRKTGKTGKTLRPCCKSSDFSLRKHTSITLFQKMRKIAEVLLLKK